MLLDYVYMFIFRFVILGKLYVPLMRLKTGLKELEYCPRQTMLNWFTMQRFVTVACMVIS